MTKEFHEYIDGVGKGVMSVFNAVTGNCWLKAAGGNYGKATINGENHPGIYVMHTLPLACTNFVSFILSFNVIFFNHVQSVAPSIALTTSSIAFAHLVGAYGASKYGKKPEQAPALEDRSATEVPAPLALEESTVMPAVHLAQVRAQAEHVGLIKPRNIDKPATP